LKVNGFPWVGIGTGDFDRTLAFFTDVLGLKVTLQGDEVAHLAVGEGALLEIFGPKHRSSELYRQPTIAFEVEDFEAARQELIGAGVELVGEAGSWNGHAWQCFRSPDGHLFEIKQVPARTE
jgi:catechol 2,3-dioxygenase-like lactoylglutathione lyase family enzyme